MRDGAKMVVFILALVFYALGLGYVWDSLVDALVHFFKE